MQKTNPYTAFNLANRQEANIAYEQFAVHADSATPLFLSLSKFQQSRALTLAAELVASDYSSVLVFGQQEQEQLKKFSSNLLAKIQQRDTSLIRHVLQDLIDHLEQIEPENLLETSSGFFKRLLTRKKQSMPEMMTHYNKLSKRIDRLGIQLTHAQQDLLNDLQLLGKLYEQNEAYFSEINVYLAAIEIKRQHMTDNVTLAADDVFGQAERDWYMQLEWLDRRLYDLELSRELAIQFSPQIRMIEQTNQLLVDKIQTALLTTIPLWQSQIALILNVNKQQRTMQLEQRMLEAQQQMNDKNNAAFTQTKHTTKEQIHSLKQTQQQLLQALQEALTTEQAIKTQQEPMQPTKKTQRFNPSQR